MLHDRPPARFRRASPSESHDLFQRLLPSLSTPALASFLPRSDPPHSTPFTTTASASSSGGSSGADSPISIDLSAFTTPAGALPALRADRPALLVSSTSWTPDEDFGMLLAALRAYERRARAGGLPRVLAVVTGKGPLRDEYMRRVERLQAGEGEDEDGPWRFVRCVSLWLEADDYPVLLGESGVHIYPHGSR